MVTFDQLNRENHKIFELSKVLLYMIEDRTICDTQVLCDVFFDLTGRVKSQLDLEERELYKDLLTHSDADIKNTAGKFLSGSAEIKRVFKQYVKRWCRNKELRIKNHEQFIAETREMFEMIQDRIIDENEKFYPVVRKVNGEKSASTAA